MGTRRILPLVCAALVAVAVCSSPAKTAGARIVRVPLYVQNVTPGFSGVTAASVDSQAWSPAAAVPPAVADSFATPAFYMRGATHVIVEYGSYNGTTLANTAPVLEVSNDYFQTVVNTPSGTGENISINGETSTATSTRRSAVILSLNNTSSGPGVPIPWRYGRIRFGNVSSGTDTLQATATVYYGSDADYDPPPLMRISCTASVAGGNVVTIPAGDTTICRIGAQIFEAHGNNKVADRTFILSRSGRTVTLNRALVADCTLHPVYLGY